MEGNPAWACNNYMRLHSEMRTRSTNDHDSEVVIKDLDFWVARTRDPDGNNSFLLKHLKSCESSLQIHTKYILRPVRGGKFGA